MPSPKPHSPGSDEAQSFESEFFRGARFERGFLRRTVLPGNPEVGEVAFYRQTHLITPADRRPWNLIPIGSVQEQIARDLVQQDFKKVFAEGYLVGVQAGAPKRDELVGRAEFEDAFPGGVLPRSLSEKQLCAVAKMGAAAVAANLNSNLEILPVSSKFFDSLWLTSIVHMGEDFELKEHWKMYMRERAAAAEMLRHFFQSNAGGRVALVYGANHAFDRSVFSPKELPDELLPRVISLTPLNPGTPDDFVGFLRDERTPPGQESLIRRANYIGLTAAQHFLSGELFLSALGKLIADPFQDDDPAEPRRHLEDAIRESGWTNKEECIRAVRAHAEAFTGPFKHLTPEIRVDKAAVGSLSPSEAGKMLEECADIPAQKEIVRAARAIDAGSFGEIYSVTGQMSAVRKLVPPDSSALSKSELYERLHLACHSFEAEGALYRAFHENFGPFRPKFWR